MGNNTELYELAGRAEALRDYIHMRRGYDRFGSLLNHGEEENPTLFASEIESIMGWANGCRKNGHPANDQAADAAADFHGPYEK